MDSAQRRAALTNRPPESRAVILSKLREYAAMSADERELKLQVTELRWYLWPLMMGTATNRAEEIAALPPSQRAMVAGRLKQWDSLSADTRKELLENGATLKYFTDMQGLTAAQQSNIVARMSVAQKQKLQEGIDRWNRLTPDQRESLAGRFNQFFALNAIERKRALVTLSAPERRQIEQTLQAFDRMPESEREQCIRSFEKFANLGLAQRQLFLKNAERWRQMTPNERQAWRTLVNKVPAPSVPSSLMPPEMPPLPRTPLVTRSTNSPAALVTNGN